MIARYRDWLEISTEAEPVTLLEGNTPLIPLPRLASELSAEAVYLKYEGLNPTGSFKDRGMTVAITEAVHRGAQAVICASTGNTAASAAAYAARAGLRCFVVVPEAKVAAGKLAGALAHRAEIVQLQASFDQALDLVRTASERLPVALVNSLNPYRIEGQKTVAFEIIEALGRAPAFTALDVALFADAGTVAAERAEVDFSDMRYSGGIGFRFRLQNSVIMRIDFAFGNEGARFMWTFADIFKLKPFGQ